MAWEAGSRVPVSGDFCRTGRRPRRGTFRALPAAGFGVTVAGPGAFPGSGCDFTNDPNAGLAPVWPGYDLDSATEA
jgi:hypothetical protein